MLTRPSGKQFSGPWAWQTFFLNQSIGIDGTNTFQLKFVSSMEVVGAMGFAGLWINR